MFKYHLLQTQTDFDFVVRRQLLDSRSNAEAGVHGAAILFPQFEVTPRRYWLFGVSSPGKSHPQALPEPDVNVSAHPAPIVQP